MRMGKVVFLLDPTMYCHERDSVVGPTHSTMMRRAWRVFPSFLFFFFVFCFNCLHLGWELSLCPDVQMPAQPGVLDMKPLPLLLCSHPTTVEACCSRGLPNLPSQGFAEEFNALCQPPALPKQLLWNMRMHSSPGQPDLLWVSMLTWLSAGSPALATALPVVQDCMSFSSPSTYMCVQQKPGSDQHFTGLPGKPPLCSSMVQQLVLQPASKWAVQMGGSTLGASAAGKKAGCDHARLCKCHSRDHLSPDRAGKPSQPLTPWPHQGPTVSNPGFGKGCSSACSLWLWVGSSVEGAALFNLPEVSCVLREQ